MFILKRVTQASSDIATLAVIGIILVTLGDVLMENLFHRPVKGAFELVELLLGVVVFFGIADVFRSEANICVDVIDHAVGPRGRSVLQTVGTLFSFVFLLILGWAMIGPAWDTVAYPQWTQEIGIPLYAFWAPILAGTALAIIAAGTVCWNRLRRPSSGGAA
jgi:TRAP-type transport system small permease protein